jgi:alpha-galactosidase
MADNDKHLYRVRAGGAECVLLAGDDEPPGIAHLGDWLGSAPSGSGFSRSQTGNLIQTATLAPLLPDPAAGWTGAPGWRDGPGTGRAWSTRIRAADADGISVAFEHADGYEAEFSVSVVSGGLFEFRLTGKRPASRTAGRIALGVPLPATAMEALCFGGRWAGEMTMQQVPLSGGLSRISRAGSRTAHDAFPGLVAGSRGFTADTGELLGVHLGWWGNYELTVETTRDSGFRAVFHLDPDELTELDDGRFQTPPLYIGWSDKGMNGIRMAFQDGVRELRQRSGAATQGKVQLNTWEGVYFDQSESHLKEMADVAADLGFERFVLDDGWFGRRTDDTRGLGDWMPRAEVYPEGLGGLIDHVQAQGLEFGLWFEPEMVNADSALFETHPDWILGESDQPLGRNQYGLDLTNTDCFNHLQNTLTDILADERIASVKWDMNRDLPQAAGKRLAPMATRLIESVRNSRQALEIEACASGGGRADLGALAWCNRVWLSDAHDPDIRTPMMAAYSLFAPPEVMGCHIGPETSHQTGRRWSMHARASMSVLASMGMELDPTTLSEKDAHIVADYIALHRQHRHWLHHGHMLCLDHPDPGLSALGVFSAERDRALIFLLQRQPRSQNVPGPLRIPHLHGDLTVSAPLVDPAFRRGAKVQPPWLTDEGFTCSAEFLTGHGLTLPIIAPMRGLLVALLPGAATELS